jgi:hypothetical protein
MSDVFDELGRCDYGARELEQADVEGEFVEAVRSGVQNALLIAARFEYSDVR